MLCYRSQLVNNAEFVSVRRIFEFEIFFITCVEKCAGYILDWLRFWTDGRGVFFIWQFDSLHLKQVWDYTLPILAEPAYYGWFVPLCDSIEFRAWVCADVWRKCNCLLEMEIATKESIQESLDFRIERLIPFYPLIEVLLLDECLFARVSGSWAPLDNDIYLFHSRCFYFFWNKKVTPWKKLHFSIFFLNDIELIWITIESCKDEKIASVAPRKGEIRPDNFFVIILSIDDWIILKYWEALTVYQKFFFLIILWKKKVFLIEWKAIDSKICLFMELVIRMMRILNASALTCNSILFPFFQELNNFELFFRGNTINFDSLRSSSGTESA